MKGATIHTKRSSHYRLLYNSPSQIINHLMETVIIQMFLGARARDRGLGLGPGRLGLELARARARISCV